MTDDDIFDSDGGGLDDLGVGDAPPGTPARPDTEAIRLLNELPDREALAVVDAMKGSQIDDLPDASQEVRDLIAMAKEYGFGAMTKPAVPAEQPAERAPIAWDRFSGDDLHVITNAVLDEMPLPSDHPLAAVVDQALAERESYLGDLDG